MLSKSYQTSDLDMQNTLRSHRSRPHGSAASIMIVDPHANEAFSLPTSSTVAEPIPLQSTSQALDNTLSVITGLYAREYTDALQHPRHSFGDLSRVAHWETLLCDTDGASCPCMGGAWGWKWSLHRSVVG